MALVVIAGAVAIDACFGALRAGWATKADAVPRACPRGAGGAVRLTYFILQRLVRIVPFFALIVGLLTAVTRLGALKDVLLPDMGLNFTPFFGGN